MRVRNIRTGVETDYPKRQALWLIGMGKCEEVKPAKPTKPVDRTKPEKAEGGKAMKPAKPTKAQTYQTKDMKADVALSQAAEKLE